MGLLSQICPASHRIDTKYVLDSSEFIWYYWRKSNNEEYLKIEKTIEVSSVLKDGKVILPFALATVIEAVRRNPDKYNNLLVRNSSSSSTAIISAQQSLSQLEDYDKSIMPWY